MEPAEIVDGTIALLRRDGWCQGQGTRGRRHCLQVALSKAAGFRWSDPSTMLTLQRIEAMLCRHIGAHGFAATAGEDLETVVEWNDTPGRTLEEVIALLEGVRAECVAMQPDEVTHRERRAAPQPLVLPAPLPQPVTSPQPAEPVPAR